MASGPTTPPPTVALTVFVAYASNTGTLHLRRTLSTPMPTIRPLPSLVRLLRPVHDSGAPYSRSANCGRGAQEGRGGDRRADGLQHGEEPARGAAVDRRLDCSSDGTCTAAGISWPKMGSLAPEAKHAPPTTPVEAKPMAGRTRAAPATARVGTATATRAVPLATCAQSVPSGGLSVVALAGCAVSACRGQVHRGLGGPCEVVGGGGTTAGMVCWGVYGGGGSANQTGLRV